MTTCRSSGGAEAPPTPFHATALAEMRKVMVSDKCNYDTAYFRKRRELSSKKPGDGLRRNWADDQPYYDWAYRILAAEGRSEQLGKGVNRGNAR